METMQTELLPVSLVTYNCIRVPRSPLNNRTFSPVAGMDATREFAVGADAQS